MPRAQATLDPAQITSPSEIPPPHAQYVGLSAQGLVDVYCGTLAGDVDALPSAKELLGAAPDTGGLSNADYIHNQVARLYGGATLPAFQSPNRNSVSSLVFVSGSSQGGFGAFHIGDGQHQAEFDRIAVDSLNASGNYSGGSHFGLALESARFKIDRLFPKSHGPSDLLGITHVGDSRVAAASMDNMRAAHLIAVHTVEAFQAALEAHDASSRSRGLAAARFAPLSDKEEFAKQLVRANQELIALVQRLTSAVSGRQYLSTALFAAEIIESFQTLTHKANPGRTDGEAVSRVVAYKLTPEVSLVPGFNSSVTHQWWADGHPDYVTVNTETDQSPDGNAAGVMFLLFLNDYLGVSLEEILQHMPATDGAPLGDTYVNLVNDRADLVQTVGRDGHAAFSRMIDLLTQNVRTSTGMLNLPADGNPFPSIPGARQGGVFKTAPAPRPARAPTPPPTPATTPAPVPVPVPSPLVQDAQAALGLETQLEQQLASLKSALQQIQGDVSGPVAHLANAAAVSALSLRYSTAAALERQVATYRAPQYDQTLQYDVWPQISNARRLQVITGTAAAPAAVSLTGTVTAASVSSGGDMVMAFQPDEPDFPTNHSSVEAPLVLVIPNQANPFDTSGVGPGTRIQAAGPLVFDRARGRVGSGGQVLAGLQIDPVVGLAVLAAPQPAAPPLAPAGQLATDLASALGQAQSLGQTVTNLTALIQKMQGP